MLDTIREYARDALADRSEDERIEQAHAAYFLDLADVGQAPEPRAGSMDGAPSS